MERKNIAPWLMSMINAEFNTTQKQSKHEKGFFCIDCGGEALTRLEKEVNHEHHTVFKPFKTSHHYAYSENDILSLGSSVLDVSGIRVFYINHTYVYFPKSRSVKQPHGLNKGRPGYCFCCGYLIAKPALFCSILCKLSCDEDDEKLKVMRMIMEQEDVGCALKRSKGGKRKRFEEKCSRLSRILKGGVGKELVGKELVDGEKCDRLSRELKGGVGKELVCEEKCGGVELVQNVKEMQGVLVDGGVQGNIDYQRPRVRHRRKGRPCRAPFY